MLHDLVVRINIELLDTDRRLKEPFPYAITKFHAKEEYMSHLKNVPHKQLARIDNMLMYEQAEAEKSIFATLENKEGIEYISPVSDEFITKKFPVTKNSYIVSCIGGKDHSWYWFPYGKFVSRKTPTGDNSYNLISCESEDFYLWELNNEIWIYTKGPAKKIIIMEG